ncbi:MAG: HAMP domain-containing protein [Acidimicrobiales bacterium]
MLERSMQGGTTSEELQAEEAATQPGTTTIDGSVLDSGINLWLLDIDSPTMQLGLRLMQSGALSRIAPPVVLDNGNFAGDEIAIWIEANTDLEIADADFELDPEKIRSGEDFDQMLLEPLFDESPALLEPFRQFLETLRKRDGTLLYPGGVQFDGELCELFFGSCTDIGSIFPAVDGGSSDVGQLVVDATIAAQAKANSEALSSYLTISLGVLGASTVAALALAWWLTGRLLRPVRDVTSAARLASAEALDQRVGYTGPDDELGQLAATFDEMLDRLERAFAAQRRFSSNAAHQMKTPLAVIRAEIDAARLEPEVGETTLEMLERIERATLRSDSVVGGLLTLAQAEGHALEPGPVDLASTVGDVSLSAAPALDARRIYLDLRLPQPGVDTVVTGDDGLIASAIENLLMNVAAHADEGSTATVELVRTDQDFRIEVTNNGPAVDDVGRLLEPYQRGAGRIGVGGHGLGLTIADAIARAHGGLLELYSVEGVFKARLVLPASARTGVH